MARVTIYSVGREHVPGLPAKEYQLGSQWKALPLWGFLRNLSEGIWVCRCPSALPFPSSSNVDFLSATLKWLGEWKPPRVVEKKKKKYMVSWWYPEVKTSALDHLPLQLTNRRKANPFLCKPWHFGSRTFRCIQLLIDVIAFLFIKWFWSRLLTPNQKHSCPKLFFHYCD